MACIVASLETHHHIRMLGEEIDDLPFPLVSPLSTNDSNVTHCNRLSFKQV
jgi:hypothetical protein